MEASGGVSQGLPIMIFALFDFALCCYMSLVAFGTS